MHARRLIPPPSVSTLQRLGMLQVRSGRDLNNKLAHLKCIAALMRCIASQLSGLHP